jgi:hypothetical protein
LCRLLDCDTVYTGTWISTFRTNLQMAVLCSSETSVRSYHGITTQKTTTQMSVIFHHPNHLTDIAKHYYRVLRWISKINNQGTTPLTVFFYMAQQPLVGQGLLINEASRSLLSLSLSLSLSHTHTHTHTHTHGRTPLEEGSARCRDLYLTTDNTHKRHPCPRRNSNPQSQQTNLRLRPCGHWDRLCRLFTTFQRFLA